MGRLLAVSTATALVDLCCPAAASAHPSVLPYACQTPLERQRSECRIFTGTRSVCSSVTAGFFYHFSTISSFLENDISFGVFSLFIFVLGCLYYFLLPLLLAKTAYKRFLAQVGDKDIHVKVSVDSKNIIIEYKGIKKERFIL